MTFKKLFLERFRSLLLGKESQKRFVRSGDISGKTPEIHPGHKKIMPVVRERGDQSGVFGSRHRQPLIFNKVGFIQPVFIQNISLVEVHHKKIKSHNFYHAIFFQFFSHWN